MKKCCIPRVWVPLLAACLSGCAHYTPNAPKTVNAREGYYLSEHKRENNAEEIIFLMSFSGGGTRAASFSYGLLEALRDTTYTTGDGQTRRLLDEVDVISSVSGGSFTSATYALYGDKIFEIFEPAFLHRNVQGTLVRKALNPLHWPALASSTYNISDLAAEYYDDILFKGATFSDLRRNNTPLIVINTTDVSTGNRLSFNQEVFDVLASDVGAYPIARAVAASSAVPGVLSPITIYNYAGQYPVAKPYFLQRTYDRPDEDAVRIQAKRMSLYEDSARIPYIHLVDGSASDNLGLRCYLDASSVLEANPELITQLGEKGSIKKVVLISVNSFVHPETGWSMRDDPPGSKQVFKAANHRTMERFSEDTQVDMRRLIRHLKPRLEGEDKIRIYSIELDFMKVTDPSRMSYLLSIPTSFVLKQDVVQELKLTARTLLYESPDFHRLIEDLGATHPDPPELSEDSPWWNPFAD